MEIFMLLLGMALVAYISYLAGMRFPSLKKAAGLFKPDTNLPNLLDKNFWKNFSQNKDIHKRCLLTLGLVLLYQLMQYIPIPGLDYNGILDVLYKTSRYGNILRPISFWGIGKYYSVFTLGVLPYLSACGILLFVSLFIRPLRRQFFDEQKGRENIVRYTLYLSLVLCVFQSYFWVLSLESMDRSLNAYVVPDPGLFFRMVGTLSLLAGFCFLLWIAELINQRGIGNGVAMIVLSDLIVSAFQSVLFAFHFFHEQNHPPGSYILYVLLSVVFILLVLYATNWKKNVEFIIGETRGRFPLRLSWFGRSPVMMAQSVLVIPMVIASFIASEALQELSSIFYRGTFIYYLVLGGLMYFSFIVYKMIITDRDYLSRLFARFDVSFPDSDFVSSFDNVMKRVMVPAIGLLFILVVAPDLLLLFWKVPYAVVAVFGFGLTSYLILSGILYDTVTQIMARIEADQKGCRAVCMTASDEIEARVKQTYLEAHGLVCVVEPYRITWALPIRTALDKYDLKVPQDKMKEAKELLNR